MYEHGTKRKIMTDLLPFYTEGTLFPSKYLIFTHEINQSIFLITKLKKNEN